MLDRVLSIERLETAILLLFIVVDLDLGALDGGTLMLAVFTLPNIDAEPPDA